MPAGEPHGHLVSYDVTRTGHRGRGRETKQDKARRGYLVSYDVTRARGGSLAGDPVNRCGRDGYLVSYDFTARATPLSLRLELALPLLGELPAPS